MPQDKKPTEVIANEELTAYLDRYFPKGDDRRGDALVIVSFANILLHEREKSIREYANLENYLKMQGVK